jgi:acyl-homoserine-lactone acylase
MQLPYKFSLLSAVLSAFVLTVPVSAQPVNPANVTIARDSFGVPHIFAKTDAEVAYGLAWANSEDAFHESQNLIYTAKGYMARKSGKSGAKVDYFVHAIGARKIVEELYDKDSSPEFKKYIEGYTQGLNAYAAAHPDEVKIKSAFPVTPKDVITAYTIIMGFMSGASGPVGDIVGGKYDKQDIVFDGKNPAGSVGSNAFGISNKRMADGTTLLCINPHVSLEGGLTFYEVHLNSEEGLNISGPMFQGCASLAMGVNENLAWSMTWNYMDKLDVFKLKMHPKKLQYELDGKYVKLEKRPVWLKVKVGGVVIPVRKMTYWSKFGATLKSDKSNNYYALRMGANMTVKTAQQLYEMNRANGFEAFRKALRNNSLSLFNVIYADKQNNLMYLCNGEIPKRNPAYDYSGIVGGNTTDAIWTEFYPQDSLPHVINPECGYIFNSNNTPFDATCAGQNDNPNRIPRKYTDMRPGNNNRSERLKEFFAANQTFTLADAKRIKFDVSMTANSAFMRSLQPLFTLDPAKHPDLKEAIALINRWDRNAEVDSREVALIGATLQNLFKRYNCADECFVSGITTNEADCSEALRMAQQQMIEWFGSIEVRWGDVHKNVRGNKVLEMRGFADVLSPSYPQLETVNGKKYFVPEHGDTYTMFVRFDKSGVVSMESLVPRGNSLNPASKHYTDQMELFHDVKLKTMSLKKEEIMKRAEIVYHPQ